MREYRARHYVAVYETILIVQTSPPKQEVKYASLLYEIEDSRQIGHDR
jgi:hypothetical protein